MKRFTLITLAVSMVLVAGCSDDEANVVAPERADQAIVATEAPMATMDALRSDPWLPPPEDYFIYEDVPDGFFLLAFYNTEEGVLSVHSTNDGASCGTPLKTKPLADRVADTRSMYAALTSKGAVFTKVYSSVTPVELDDFLADACLFLDTAMPVAADSVHFHFQHFDQAVNESVHTGGTTPYTLTISGSLERGEDRVHLTLLRQYLIPPSSDPASGRSWPVKWIGPTLKGAGDGGV